MATDPDPSARPATRPETRASKNRAASILILLASAALLVNYIETMLVPALPRLVTFFDGAPYTTVAWIVSIYLLTGVVSTPIFAKLGDIYGKKRVLVLLLGVYAFAVALAGFTPQLAGLLGLSRANAIYLLIGVRGFQGLGLAMFPLSFAMVGEELPAAQVAPAQGLISAMFAVGAAAGLFGGAWLIQSYGWQFAYESVVPLAALVVVLAARTLPESRHRLSVPLDVPGAALLGGALTAFLLGLTLGPSWGWSSVASVHPGGLPFGVPDLFLLSAIAAVGFVLRERSTAAPIINLGRFRERNIAVSYTTALLVGAALFSAFVALTVLVESPGVGLGRSIFQFGEMSLPTTLSMLLAAPFVGQAVVRFGPRPVMLLGSATSTTGFLLLLAFHGSYLQVLLEAVPTFVGLIALLVPVTNVIVLSSRRGETGIQTGMTEMFQDLGASIGPVVVSSILATFTQTYQIVAAGPAGPVTVGVVLPSGVGFEWIFALGAAMTFACGGLASLLHNFTFDAAGSRTDHRAAEPAPGPAAASADAPGSPLPPPVAAASPEA